MASITDIAGLLVGHWHDHGRATGCTVALCPAGASSGLHVAGGAPGTRETDLLQPGRLVEQVHAILLTGGSAFGLATVTAHTGLARAIRPAHTLADGDTIFALSLPRPDAPAANPLLLGIAAEVMAAAIVSAVTG